MLEAPEKARLTWRCRRGMLELDLVLQSFLEERVHLLDKRQLLTFESLLTSTDPELYAWLMDHEKPPKEFAEIVILIRADS
jgi:antitoxin CptB